MLAYPDWGFRGFSGVLTGVSLGGLQEIFAPPRQVGSVLQDSQIPSIARALQVNFVLAEARFQHCWTPSRGSTAKKSRLLLGKVP